MSMLLLFALGSNGSGQLGIGHKEDVSVPKQVVFSSEDDDQDPVSSVSRIVAGGNHTLLITGSGALLWSGDPASGSCGKVTTAANKEAAAAAPQFRAVDLSALVVGREGEQQPQPPRIRLSAATWEASIIAGLDEHGLATKVYSFGSGTKGELGLGEFIFRTPTPSAIPGFPPPGTEVVDLSACMGHVVAVLSNGEIWGWGNGRKGQLGAPDAVVNSPRKVDGINFKVVKAVCGREFTCLFGSPENGEILVLGSDKWDVKSKSPTRVPGWKEVGASWGNVYVLNGDGSLLSWGRDDHGQIAPEGLPRTKSIAVGSEHVLALSAEGEVTAWGWGEHGNCGPLGTSKSAKGQQNVIASSKYIPPGSKITKIGAGCATSWVAIEMPAEDPQASSES
ncbi:regulator of chromosome condensation 1/beta-lactamase-inhibitor protein II [Podospora didyma]|uniref:Regulator of chromosome condensation 1/beta-lactamase-inhibitor protein II n=1 Tax=Podospora didyma TaxID=330526 RepID=A0AAE0K2C5_9PEZI|nr:regulator of chromosome condensation 1/beta-lactamase-inhibitor protein II [Podospora didyma]